MCFGTPSSDSSALMVASTNSAADGLRREEMCSGILPPSAHRASTSAYLVANSPHIDSGEDEPLLSAPMNRARICSDMRVTAHTTDATYAYALARVYERKP